MSPIVRNMFVAAAILTSFAVFGGGLVVFTYTHTKDIIAANERAALLANLHALVPEDRYDNALAKDSIDINDPAFFGTQEPITVYRAYQNGQPVAVLATLSAPDGYSGPIKLLVGVYADGTLAGARVLAHQETPGLGDAIETARSDWIYAFAGKSLTNPKLKDWAVKKDGGAFDQFTGATITPRAVVKAIRRFLGYFQSHRQQILRPKRTTSGEAL